jgi:hypothetical protein
MSMYISLRVFIVIILVSTPANSWERLKLLRISLIGFVSGDIVICKVGSISLNVTYMNVRLCRSMESVYNSSKILC